MPGPVMKFIEPDKNGRIYQEPGVVYAPYIPIMKHKTIPTLNMNIKQIAIPVYEKDFRFCKLSYPIIKSDLKLCKKIVTDNTLKIALLNMRHDNETIRKLCQAKINNRKISRYYYIKWTGRKLRAKFSLEKAADIQACFGMGIFDNMAAQIADEVDRELLNKLKTWHTTIEGKQNDKDINA